MGLYPCNVTSASSADKSITCLLHEKHKQLISLHLLFKKYVSTPPTHAAITPMTVISHPPFRMMKSGFGPFRAPIRFNTASIDTGSLICSLHRYVSSGQSLYLALGCLALYSSAFCLPSLNVTRFL